MKVYKGTDKDMKCRGFQYKLGEAAVFDGQPHLCRAGLHACEQPIDVLNHYAPNESRYFEADAEGVTDERESNDSKIVAKKAAIVDGEKIKADTWYQLKTGEFVEVE